MYSSLKNNLNKGSCSLRNSRRNDLKNLISANMKRHKKIIVSGTNRKMFNSRHWESVTFSLISARHFTDSPEKGNGSIKRSPEYGIDDPNSNGDVVGPIASDDSAIALYDGSSGKLLKNSPIKVSSYGSISGVTDIELSGELSCSTSSLDIAATTVNFQNNLVSNAVLGSSTIVGITNNVDANSLRNGSTYCVPLGGAAPTTGQVLQYDGTNAVWATRATGDVKGPPIATTNAIPRYDGASGKILKGSPVAISDSGVVSGITQLNTGPIILTENSNIFSAQTSASKNLITAYMSTSPNENSCYRLLVNGTMLMGPGGNLSTDVRIQRSGTGTIRIDNTTTNIGGTLEVNNVSTASGNLTLNPAGNVSISKKVVGAGVTYTTVTKTDLSGVVLASQTLKWLVIGSVLYISWPSINFTAGATANIDWNLGNLGVKVAEASGQFGAFKANWDGVGHVAQWRIITENNEIHLKLYRLGSPITWSSDTVYTLDPGTAVVMVDQI